MIWSVKLRLECRTEWNPDKLEWADNSRPYGDHVSPAVLQHHGDRPDLLGEVGGKRSLKDLVATNKTNVTSGVSRVDDAQGPGVAVRPGLVHGALQLADVQAPALLFIQVIVDLHRSQFCQGSRVERILGNGDHDACAGRALTTHEQF